jgi:hypothetical protein
MAKDKKKSTRAGWRVNKTTMMDFPPVRPEAAEQVVKDLMGAAERLRRSMTGLPGPAKPERQTQAAGWQLDRIYEMLPIAFPPDGRVPSDLTHKAVQRRLEPLFKKKGWRLPSPDSIRRARERQNSRG